MVTWLIERARAAATTGWTMAATSGPTRAVRVPNTHSRAATAELADSHRGHAS